MRGEDGQVEENRRYLDCGIFQHWTCPLIQHAREREREEERERERKREGGRKAYDRRCTKRCNV